NACGDSRLRGLRSRKPIGFRQWVVHVISILEKLKLKYIENQYGAWYALLTLEEEKDLLYQYVKFDLIDKEFKWYSI
ncbi:MAG: hypothetical protein K1W39_15005, partial [Lachnospiraceae bacterium]